MTASARPRPFAAVLASALVRFWLGTAGAAAGGYVAFGRALLQPEHPAFQCITVGMLCSGMLTLVRLSLRVQAAILALAFGVLRLGLSDNGRWVAGLAGVLLGLGLLVVAEIYNELARIGFRFGKFLLVGPLLGGVLLALAPIVEFHELIQFDAVRPILVQFLIGVVVGDGAGLGIELAELHPWTAGLASPAGATAARASADAAWKSRQRTY